MINRIIDLSVAHRYVVLLLIAILCGVGYWSMVTIPVDATPDLSDTQVIIASEWDRSPDVMEDQVTYPLVTALLGAPHVKTVRGLSDYGTSFIYVIFDDGTDLYWARSRTLEYLSGVLAQLPEGVRTRIGPDATGLDWVYQYALTDTTGRMSAADLRSYQDWTLRYALKAVPGVAEVATVGGFQRQFQVNIDPARLLAYGLSIRQVAEAVQGGNTEAGGRLLEFGGSELMVRGRGYARSIEEFENIMVKASADGASIRIRDLGRVEMGPALRRGAADLNGRGETVSGTVIMRSGGDPLTVINRVKAKLEALHSGLPTGLRVIPVYDRSELIHKAIGSVRSTMLEVLITVTVIILVFLWHFPSAVIPIITIPVVVLLTFIPLRLMGVSANIMSLAGIAIAFSELVDASIVVAEQTHKKLEAWQRCGARQHHAEVIVGAIKQVAGPIFFALLILAISFLPVFTLQAEEGRMFRPLAISKSLTMIAAALLVVTFEPALRLVLLRMRPTVGDGRKRSRVYNMLFIGRMRSEQDHPISRMLIRLYRPVVDWTLNHKGLVFGGTIAAMLVTIPAYLRLGSEFMPPLDEGTILYMPSTMPGISITEARRLLFTTDQILRQFPEVDQVLGKAGRADTATDPAPLSMLETVITLKPRSKWRHVDTWYSAWAPGWTLPLLRQFSSDHISTEDLVARMDAAIRIPGLVNAWTMPVKGRLDMLATGIRTPIGIKVTGPDSATLERVGQQIEEILRPLAGTRNVYAERVSSGSYLDIIWDRDALARAGISMADAQSLVQHAIGGEDVTTAIVGRQRFPVQVRLIEDYRSNISDLKHLRLASASGRQVIVGDLAVIRMVQAPAMVRDEDGLLTSYVYIDTVGRDVRGYVAEGQRLLDRQLQLPAGSAYSWSGQYEAMSRARRRLLYIVPLTILLVAILLYFSTRSVVKTGIVLLAVPFSAIGSVWLLYLAHYHLSIAVWVGIIALMGVDAQTGVFMLLYLDIAWQEACLAGRLRTPSELRAAIIEGAANRVRPKFMTFATTWVGLLPILWSTGVGADLMKRIAAPMAGGILTSFLLELLVYPALYATWKARSLAGGQSHSDASQSRFTGMEVDALQ